MRPLMFMELEQGFRLPYKLIDEQKIFQPGKVNLKPPCFRALTQAVVSYQHSDRRRKICESRDRFEPGSNFFLSFFFRLH